MNTGIVKIRIEHYQEEEKIATGLLANGFKVWIEKIYENDLLRSHEHWLCIEPTKENQLTITNHTHLYKPGIIYEKKS
ncbi:MAG: hypothetical protein GY804_01040 [Alphaproteobacteria bacterium]|nr:hypothetical protein [Alphaproteobacteria bacterium]